MRQGIWRPTPAFVLAAIALFVALGGSVYAATKISGKAIKVKSLPGNRLKVASVPANRLKPGAIQVATQSAGPITGAEIDELSLGQVPEAAHAESADTARNAVDAQTALNAVNAVNAASVNGHSAGCLPSTQPFAGACWQSSASETALTAPAAASSCAAQGGTLPEALQLAAFSQQPGVTLAPGDEWSSDVPVVSAPNLYGVAVVSASGEINSTVSTSAKKYRCVIPLLT